MRYHYMSIRMAKVKILTILSIGRNVEKFEFFYTVGEKVIWYNYFGKQFGNFLKIKHR